MTRSISLIAPAKLNLNLSIKKKLKNGYHSLESDVCFLNLYDEIKIEINNFDSIEISDNSTFILRDESILLKTLNCFNREFKNKKKFKITLNKNIPIGAGLGGGSSDSAALLLGLRYFYNRNPHNSKKNYFLKTKGIRF